MKKLFLALILLAVYPHVLFAQNDITFQVNMNVQMQMGMFDTTKDIVVVRG